MRLWELSVEQPHPAHRFPIQPAAAAPEPPTLPSMLQATPIRQPGGAAARLQAAGRQRAGRRWGAAAAWATAGWGLRLVPGHSAWRHCGS